MSMRMGGVYMGNQILRRTAIALFTICLLSLPALGNSGGPLISTGTGTQPLNMDAVVITMDRYLSEP